jgi:predicted signal transduction protein with EAL and GGDEF domain
VNVNCVQKKFAAISFSNVSEIKNYETALNEQTKKLENVSHQLFSSQENIDIQLKNIQTLNEQLLFAAYHDSLTNLYNRAWLKINLNLIISEAKKAHEKFSILLFDIDNMKNVNNSRGHEAGDDLLKQSAAIKASGIGTGDDGTKRRRRIYPDLQKHKKPRRSADQSKKSPDIF